VAWFTEGTWEHIDPNDPRCVHREDQLRAATADKIRNANTFVAFTIDPDSAGNACDVMAIFEPDATNDGADKESVMRSIADLLVRLWFEDTTEVSSDDDLSDEDKMYVMLMASKIMQNMSVMVAKELHRKGIV